jgi:hypothetical protein
MLTAQSALVDEVDEVARLLFAQERAAAWVVQYVPGRVAIVAGEHARDERACEGVYVVLAGAVGGVDDGQAEARAEYRKLRDIRQAGVCLQPKMPESFPSSLPTAMSPLGIQSRRS